METGEVVKDSENQRFLSKTGRFLLLNNKRSFPRDSFKIVLELNFPIMMSRFIHDISASDFHHFQVLRENFIQKHGQNIHDKTLLKFN